MSSNNQTGNRFRNLEGGGEMGALIRAYDWSSNVLGPPEGWPQSLLTTLSIMLNTRFPMFLWWGADLIQFYNDAYRPSLGNDGKHPVALGQKGAECWPEIWPVIKPLIDQVVNGGEAVFFEDQLIPIYRNNRLEDVYWTFSYSRVNDESGEPGGVLVVCNETTGEVQSRQDLLRAKDDLEFAVNAAELGTWDFNPVTRKFIGNKRIRTWLGLGDEEEIDLERALSAVADRDRDRVRLSIAEALTYGSSGQYDITYSIMPLAPEGKERIVRAIGRSVFNKNNQPVKFSGTLHDVTAEVKSAEELNNSKQRLELALQAAKLGSYDLNLTTGEMICNAQYKANFGIPPERPFAPEEYLQAILPEYVDDVMARRDYAIENNDLYRAEYPVRWPDGSIHWISVHGKPYYEADGTVRILGVSSDITEQVNVKIELNRMFEQSKLSKEAAQLGTFDMDIVNGTLEWDDRCRTLFGISHTNTVTYEKDFLTGLHEEDRARIEDVIRKVFIKSESDGIYDVEYRTVGAEDKKIRWVRAKGKAYFDEQDRPLRFIGAVLDITEQKNDEIRKNDFISMVSHELKTPLTSIKAYIQMLIADEQVVKDSFMDEALQKVDIQVNRMASLIDGFLNISRLESGKLLIQKRVFNLNSLIDLIKDDARLIFNSHVIKVTHCEQVFVFADREKIGSVILNLLSNAVKYSPKGSTIHIDCTEEKNYVKISVADQGRGISELDLKKLFDRFYRVENKQNQFISGFGIGLYLCAEIIHGHNGEIWVESEPEKGSVFYFTLPLEEDQPGEPG